MWMGGQFANANASLGVLRLFLEFALPCLNEGQNGFLSKFGILRRVRLVRRTAVAAMKAPPPTTAPHANPTDTRIEELRFFLDDGGMSVL